MAHLLLSTKLFFPRARVEVVFRPRLIEQLTASLRKPLTLISAPAGYGKTTLLSDWRLRVGSEYPLAWLSLEPGDNNLARFLAYISAALATIDPALSQDLESQLHLPQLPPLEELITSLINGVSAFPQDFALILDDCHVITEPAIHAALSYLLDHQPPKMHLVMLTRADPPLHLAKLRGRGDLAEIRTHDLRFSSEEAATFLNEVMALRLSGDNIQALDHRTEGWAVGLQMAALSLQNKDDADAFINAFTGSNRYILDFLSEEVIQGQPEDIQTFLLQTSILDRLNGPLCDAVLGGTMDSAQILLDLDRKNLFLIPLDEERQWYRYHHLFSDLLFQCLKQTQPGVVFTLYERAALWFEQNHYLENAVGYALKAQDYDLATRCMDQIRLDLLNHGDVRLLNSWFNTLPEELVRSQPELCFSNATNLTMQGYFEAAEKWLQLAEAGSDQMSVSNVKVSLDRYKFLIYRSVYARCRGDFATALDLSQQTVELVPVTSLRDRGVALLFLGHAYFYAGNTPEAEQALDQAIQATLASGHLGACLNACHHLAKLRVLQGRLHDARAVYEYAVEITRQHPTPIYTGTEYACLGDLKREWNQLAEASPDIQKGVELAEAGDHIFFLVDVYIARIRLALARKDWAIAESYLQKAKQVAGRCPASTDNTCLQVWQARIWLAHGSIFEAVRWAESVQVDDTGSLSPQREFELLSLARIWLAHAKLDQVAVFLNLVHTSAAAAGRAGVVLEAEMLQALVNQAAGDEKCAIERLTPVLARAEPEGYIRLFVDEGAPMAKLLYKAVAQLAAPVRDYAEKLLAAFLKEDAQPPSQLTSPLPGDMLIEPLSKREIEVLRLLAGGCANKEIASQLVISTGTVKRHVVHIFQKLGAANRTQAVAIARRLEII